MKLRKILISWLAIAMVLSVAYPASLPAAEKSSVEVDHVIELDVSQSLFSLTETRTTEVRTTFNEEVDPEQIDVQFGGKDLSEWRKWTGSSNYDGDPFINVIEGPAVVEGTNEVTATIEFGLPFNRTDLSNRTIRVQYQDLIGEYELSLVNHASGEKAATTVQLNVYDEFLFYDELKPAIDQVFEEAKADTDNTRYLDYQKVGESAEGRDIHFVVLARDEAAVDTYLNETLPQALEDPASLIEKLENGTMGDYQLPIWFNNIHPDEVEGVDAQVELLKKFALEEEVTFTNTDEDGNEEPVSLNMDEVLNNVIFLYMFTSNPDGRVANTRANAEGFDLNRDNAYQTQAETQQVNELISTWTPLSFVDMHGYVNGFLIEPGTPPHNPNFEYDLLIHNMMDQAHAMGRAGVGNSNLTDYFIAQLEWEDGWDDMTPAYTAIYAMLHGSLGHTIEVPTLSQDSLHAMVGVGLGSTYFVTENKDELFKQQLEIFKRGVNGEDNRAVDEYFVNADGEEIGRVRHGHDSFFPDYYVIPTDKEHQKNVLEAHKMAEYLLRNGVKVEETTRPVHLQGETFPKGTFVIPMNQAKRGLANAVLYQGDNVSDWNAMYDPVVVNFPALRGFDQLEVREEGVFKGVTQEMAEVNLPTGELRGNAPKQVVRSTSNDTVKLINALLNEGKKVELAVESKGNISRGDYIISTQDLRSYESTFYFEAHPAGNGKGVETEQVVQPKVAATGSSQLNFSLRQLGFTLVKPENAGVIVSDTANFNNQQAEGKTFIGIGGNALRSVSQSGVLEGFKYEQTRGTHEGLVKTNVNPHKLTAGYEANELLYVTTGSYITEVPESAEVLLTFSEAEDFYVSGWWPGHAGAKGQTMAFTSKVSGTTYTLFANDLAFRAHTEHSYRLLANSIFDATVN
ncbi:M14 family metallopeptidase [Alkalihalophilus marmarensis]|jgi:murein tripeptide amidase MpaA|uniref:M14 family metallopeptidase n=1 Tax=Alkalihalophilus marmarensis TaxID=521377 RepID=UPI00203EA50E|nr:M14 family zinc carboxypeptidase [Alkalihalophilus marmarensis]MCM3489201.1 M14 family metallopeptidase [Alkalihalophilus marmarensis]